MICFPQPILNIRRVYIRNANRRWCKRNTEEIRNMQCISAAPLFSSTPHNQFPCNTEAECVMQGFSFGLRVRKSFCGVW